MRILIDINHPADVHQFKNMIFLLEKHGHDIKVTARDKDVSLQLLDAYKIPYTRRKGYKGIIGKTIGIFIIDHFLYQAARGFDPDLMIGSSGNCYIAQVSKLIGKPSIIFSDTEFATWQNRITFPFATKICTPSCFYLNLGDKQVRYNGCKELAYLHPHYFKPAKDVLKKMNLRSGEKYAIIRLVSFQASHDMGFKGISEPIQFITELSKHSRIFISSEDKLPDELEGYMLKVAPEDMHSVLYYASLLLGDSATMAAESAVLGVPAIFVSDSKRGYTEELASRYDLVLNFHTREIKMAIDKAIHLITDNNTKAQWNKRRLKMIKDKIDVTKWMMDYIEALNKVD